MSRLTAVRTHPIGNTKPRKARPKARAQAHPIAQAPVADLADALDRAIEASRDAASERDVRVSCAMLDPLHVEVDDTSLEATLGEMLSSAIANCVWGSRIECEPVRIRDRIVLRIRFLRPGTGQSSWSVEDGEICVAWMPAAGIETYGSKLATTGA